jgi:hypothetical protein
MSFQQEQTPNTKKSTIWFIMQQWKLLMQFLVQVVARLRDKCFELNSCTSIVFLQNENMVRGSSVGAEDSPIPKLASCV